MKALATPFGRTKCQERWRPAPKVNKPQDVVVRTTMHAYDWEGAMEVCQQLLARDPEHLGALETLAQAQWFGCQYNKVILTTSKLLRLNPCEPGYRYTRGMAFLSKGDLIKAHEDFQTALIQSNNEAFKAQVTSSLDSLERYILDGKAAKPGTFALGKERIN